MVLSKNQAIHKLLLVVGLLFFLLVTLQSPAQTLNHKMNVEILPSLKTIKAEDTLRFPKDTPRKLSFLLHKDLNVAVISADDSLTLLHPATQNEPYAEYGLTLGSQDDSVTLSFYGVIYDQVHNQDSNGLISADGATLFESTYWYPTVLGMQKSFDVTIKTPGTWRTIMQGQLTSLEVKEDFTVSRYTEIYPQEELYLVAAPFKVYSNSLPNGKNIQVLLRQEDPALAQNFLTVMPEYLQHYSELIGPYPYSSFSVVENLWETGYGMPSFTLLGPSVLRLPFILNSSLPHEILHNWWGNSVYVDYDKGNWSEGLTTYMADYWQAEKSGNDRTYRLTALMNYADFVESRPEKDFPLTSFHGRHNSSSQAIGYGKSMMFFHMLERRVGTEVFNKTLQDFYTSNIFKRASFADIQTSFEKFSKESPQGFFNQWLTRTGALELELTDAKVLNWTDGSFAVSLNLSQLQKDLYDVEVPVIVSLENASEMKYTVRTNAASQTSVFVSGARPVKISVDPDFHLFRKLYAEERPATLSSIFGSSAVHFYADPRQLGAQKFVRAWKKNLEGKVYSHTTDESIQLPDDGALVFLGDENAFAEFMKAELSDQKFELSDTTMKINGEEFLLSEASTVVMTRMKGRAQQTVAWIRWSADNSPEDWANRLLHYGNFGVLVFKGRPPVVKTTWPVMTSPLQKRF